MPKGFYKQKSGSVDSVQLPVIEKDGIASALLEPSQFQSQTITAGSGTGVSGAFATFPPGSLAVSSTITLQAGGSILSSSAASSLGIDATSVDTAGSAVVIGSSAGIDASTPFTLAIPAASGASLMLADDKKLVIVYKVHKYSEGGELSMGFFAPSKVRKSGDLAIFTTTYFGSYQAAYTTSDVEAVAEKKTTEPIIEANFASKVDATQVGNVVQSLDGGTKYYWKVIAKDKNGNRVGESDVWEFTTK